MLDEKGFTVFWQNNCMLPVGILYVLARKDLLDAGKNCALICAAFLVSMWFWWKIGFYQGLKFFLHSINQIWFIQRFIIDMFLPICGGFTSITSTGSLAWWLHVGFA